MTRALKSLGLALIGVLLINVLALGGLVGWLAATGRLSQDRVERVIELFEPTVAEAERQREEARQQAEAEREKAERAARLEQVKDGPDTLQDRLARAQREDEMARHRLKRFEAESENLRQQMERAKQRLEEQKAELEAKREQFEQFVEERTERMQEEDFQKTVQMYENLRPEQAKQMFQELLNEGKEEEVVDYLAAMQLRRAAKILERFEGPNEIQQATGLLERLRERGVQPLAGESLEEGGQT
jgi:colicin import membrane protein